MNCIHHDDSSGVAYPREFASQDSNGYRPVYSIIYRYSAKFSHPFASFIAEDVPVMVSPFNVRDDRHLVFLRDRSEKVDTVQMSDDSVTWDTIAEDALKPFMSEVDPPRKSRRQTNFSFRAQSHAGRIAELRNEYPLEWNRLIERVRASNDITSHMVHHLIRYFAAREKEQK